MPEYAAKTMDSSYLDVSSSVPLPKAAPIPPITQYEPYSVTELDESPVLAPNETVLSGPIRIIVDGPSWETSSVDDSFISELVLPESCLEGALVNVSDLLSHIHDLPVANVNTTENISSHIRDIEQTRSIDITSDRMAQRDESGIIQSFHNSDETDPSDPHHLNQTTPIAAESDEMSFRTAQDFVDHIQDLNGYSASEIHVLVQNVTDILHQQTSIIDGINTLVEKQESSTNNNTPELGMSTSSMASSSPNSKSQSETGSSELQSVANSVALLDEKLSLGFEWVDDNLTNLKDSITNIHHRVQQLQESTSVWEKEIPELKDQLSILSTKLSLEATTNTGFNSPSQNLTLQSTTSTTPPFPTPSKYDETTALGILLAFLSFAFLIPGPTIGLTLIVAGVMCVNDAIRNERPSSVLCFGIGVLLGFVGFGMALN